MRLSSARATRCRACVQTHVDKDPRQVEKTLNVFSDAAECVFDWILSCYYPIRHSTQYSEGWGWAGADASGRWQDAVLTEGQRDQDQDQCCGWRRFCGRRGNAKGASAAAIPAPEAPAARDDNHRQYSLHVNSGPSMNINGPPWVTWMGHGWPEIKI